MDVVNAYPAVMYSQGCLGALLQMSVDADGLITSSFKVHAAQLHAAH